jgi:polyhydroxybutyrate depolymerase
MTLVGRTLVLCASLAVVACGSTDDPDGMGNANPQNTTPASPSPGCAAPSVTPGDQVIQISHGGVQREYTLHVPPEHGDKPVKLVMNFHGLTSNMDQQIFFSGMNADADAGGFLVAYPNGLPNPGGTTQSWNAGTCCAFGDTTRDDVGFTRAVVADIGSRACVDERRVFSTGMSNGGYMSHRLACEAAELFTAVAPVSGTLGMPACNPSRPVPIIAFNGTEDSLVAYGPIPAVMADWAERNQCTEGPSESFRNASAHCDTWSGCAEGVKVTLCTLDGMGHCWPGQSVCPFGAATTDLAANAAMIEFFAPYALP